MIQPALVSLPSIATATATRAAGSDLAGDFGGTLAALIGPGVAPAAATLTVTTTMTAIPIAITSPMIGITTRQPPAATGKALPGMDVMTGTIAPPGAAPLLTSPVLAVIAPVMVASSGAAVSGPAASKPQAVLPAPDLLPEEPIPVDGLPAGDATPPPKPIPIGHLLLPRPAMRTNTPSKDRPTVSTDTEEADDSRTPGTDGDLSPLVQPAPVLVMPVVLVEHGATPSVAGTVVTSTASDGLASASEMSVTPPPLARRDRGIAQAAPADVRTADATTQVTTAPSGQPMPTPMTTPTPTPMPMPMPMPMPIATPPDHSGPLQRPGLLDSGAAFRDSSPVTGPAPDLPPRWSTQDTAPALTLVAQQPTVLAVQPQPGTVASAAQVFGAAIQAASRGRDETTDRADIPGLGGLGAPAATAPAITAVAQTAQQQPLDMRQERWPSAMIERIEVLRDAANSTDTRIRLIPDALGAIDVSVRRDGDTLHVHFNAEQAATRTLLQDAQPRLAELADARGLKLSQGAVETGGGSGTGQHQQRAATPQPQLSSTPARGVRSDATAETDSTDTRLA